MKHTCLQQCLFRQRIEYDIFVNLH
jgi:hypothetical protein